MDFYSGWIDGLMASHGEATNKEDGCTFKTSVLRIIKSFLETLFYKPF